MSENKKNIWLAVAGVGALVGAALLYHYASGTTEEDDAPSRDELVQQLKS